MRSLHNIIKASRFDTANFPPLEEKAARLAANPAELPAPPQNPGVPAAAVSPQEERHAIMNDALSKAKTLVEAAQNYSLQQLQESTARMNEECAQRKLEGYRQGLEQGAQEGRSKGYADGYSEGYAQGQKQARQEVQETLDALARMIDTAEQKGSDLLAHYESDLESLAVTIAQKILRRELIEDPCAIRTLVQNVLGAYRNVEWVTVTVSPETAEKLTAMEPAMAQALREVSGNIKITACPEMKNGDCVIDLPDRRIDAGADSQMSRVKMALGL